jgi:hypothetical protein
MMDAYDLGSTLSSPEIVSNYTGGYRDYPQIMTHVDAISQV